YRQEKRQEMNGHITKKKFPLSVEAERDAQSYEVPSDVSEAFRRGPVVVNRFYEQAKVPPCKKINCQDRRHNMSRKTVGFNQAGASNLPNNKPVVYKILTDAGKTNYVGIAKRGRVQERIQEHLSA